MELRVFAGSMGRRGRSFSLILFALALSTAFLFGMLKLAGLDAAPDGEIWRQRQAAVDPLQLWSIEVVPAQAGWPPAQICTNAWMRTGFARPDGMVGDQSCLAIEDPVVDAGRTAFRCKLNGRTLGISSTVAGDIDRDFTAKFSVTELAGFLSGRPNSAYEQTRHYRRLGACPSDWAVGEYTDRLGRRQKGALIVHDAPTGR